MPCNNRLCRYYRQLVEPEVNGLVKRCPQCKTMVKGSKLAQIYALDEGDVSYRAEQHARDFQADTTYLRGLCEELAECDLSIKKMRKGSAEHQRLFSIRNDLHDKLKAHRVERRAEAAGTSSGGGRVTIFRLPDNGRDALPSREVQPTVEPAAPAAVGPPASGAPSRTDFREARVEPEPDVWVRGHRVTERDVRRCLEHLGDRALADFMAGRLPKSEAYEMAARWLREMDDLGRRA